jgi:hypothetical protein
MRKVFAALMVVATTIVMAGLTTGPAAALGSERLGCYITPTHTVPLQLHANSCSTGMMASSYQATFGVMNQNGSYSYAWSVPAQYAGNITSGCTTTERCNLSNLIAGSEVTVSVTITQNGQSAKLSATAYINQWCGNIPCG